MRGSLVLGILTFCHSCLTDQSFGAPSPELAANRPAAKGEGPKAFDAKPAVVFKALCNALRDNYPMLELAGWRDEEWPREFEIRIEAAPTREAAFELMDELVCRLNDYHTRLSWSNRTQIVSAPFRVEPVVAAGNAPTDHGIWGKLCPPVELPDLGGVAIAVTTVVEGCGLASGDEILSVDDLPVHTALAQAWLHSVCSSVAGKLRSAAGRMLQGAPGE
jgi:hypothetical protein